MEDNAEGYGISYYINGFKDFDGYRLNGVVNGIGTSYYKNGNKYRILARSGRTNKSNRDILDLNTVRGEISSKQRSTIFIISEFADYNSSTLGSKFYQNVVINYEDKQITCENFDINMDTNIAIAYNNVVVTDPKSIMRAGKITLDIETKEIDINPDTDEKSKVKINTKQ